MIPHARLAELARDAYTAPPTVARGDVRAVRTIIDGTAVWAFPGTSDVANAARDAFGLPWYDPVLGWCHVGFLDAARILMLDVAFETDAKAPIVLVGHSLGGAIAAGIGASFAARGRSPAEIVTFNAPRFGSFKFCRALNGVPITMYRWRGDLVSVEPPWWLGYRNRVPWTYRGTWKPPLHAHAMTNFVPLT